MRDPKLMAQTLRDDLGAKSIKVAHSECLEITSHMLGFADWNTLSAATSKSSSADEATAPSTVYPAIPVRDAVFFPVDHFPLLLKRSKTLRALKEAFRVKRQIVIVAQKRLEADDPIENDMYSVGVLARVVDFGKLPEAGAQLNPDFAGATKVLIQPLRRVRILSFESSGEAYQARVVEPDEGPVVSVPALMQSAATVFAKHAASEGITIPTRLQMKSAIGDAGYYADLIAARARIPLSAKQELLEMFEPVSRLERVIAMLETN